MKTHLVTTIVGVILALPNSYVYAASQLGEVQKFEVKITDSGYEPDSLTMKANEPAEITFIRTTDGTCGTEVVFPVQKIKENLPLNRPVTVKFTPKAGEKISFTCGMGMLTGAVVAQ
jgi:plastocyanin domain-containing protein